MARDISIAISAKDNFTQAITTMRNANTGFNKDLEGLSSKLNALNSTKVTLKMETDKARQQLKEAERQFLKTGEAAEELAVKLAAEEYEGARRNLSLVSKNAQQAEKDILSLTDAVNRSGNRVGGDSGGIADAQQAVATAGMGKMLGDSLTGALNTGISSAFGSNLGSAISTTLSGALSGAAMGSIAGPVGMAVGAAVGTIAGGISAATEMFAKEDEAFKAVRNEMVEGALQSQQNTLDAGIGVATSRQKTGVQLRHQFGDEQLAEEYLQNTIALANQTPFFYDDLVGVGSTYKAFGFQNDELYEEQLRIANAAAIRGWDASGMEQIASNLGFMRQSGKIDTMRVKQLQMAGLNVPRYLAIAGSDLGHELSDADIREMMGFSEEQLRESGVTLTEDDIYAMISKGDIDGKQAAQAISKYMAIEFEGGAEKLAETYYGLESTLGGMEQQMQYAMGEGYTAAREQGLRDQISFMSGDQGDQLQEAYGMIGQWQASLDNTREQMEREIMTAIMGGDLNTLTMDLYFPDNEEAQRELQERLQSLNNDYQLAIAEEDGAKAGRILAKAQIVAQSAYNASEGVTMMTDSLIETIDEASKALASDARTYNAGKMVGDKYSEGLMASIQDCFTDALWGGTAETIQDPRQQQQRRMRDYAATGTLSAPGNAWGIDYVPYDNYLTYLHQGERVQTAQEARSAGQPISVSISGNEFSVREEADIYKIAQALAEELARAQQVS